MKNISIAIALIVLLIAGVTVYSITKDSSKEGQMDQHENDHSGSEIMNETDTQTEDHSMTNMDDMHSTKITDEKSFIENMIPHHQEAVDTSKDLLRRGTNSAEMTTLLQGIITSQEKEIADMKSWYKAWYGTSYQAKDTYTPMMRDLSSLSGVELQQAFLDDMIMHHMGAIMMAQSVAQYIEHPQMQTLAEAIASDQSNEIITMRMMQMEI